jgi:hypothetical protein
MESGILGQNPARCHQYVWPDFGQSCALDFLISVILRWVRLVSFLVAKKINSLKMLPISRRWVRFSSFFGHRFLERKAKHEGTKEDEDTKTRRRRISARGAWNCVSSLRLRVLVVGLMPAPGRESIWLE